MSCSLKQPGANPWLCFVCCNFHRSQQLHRFSILAFSGLGKIEHPCNTPTRLGRRRQSLVAKCTRLLYFEHVREKLWNISTLIRKQLTPKNQRKMENRKINTAKNSHGNKLSTRTNAFQQLFHQRQQPLSTIIIMRGGVALYDCNVL